MLRLTQVTSRSPKRLSKHYELHNGELIKEPGGKMSEGTCSVREIADMEEFAELLSGLRTNEALIYGVPKGMDTAKIVRSAAYEQLPEEKRVGIVARTTNHFEWPDGPGIFMLDYDPDDEIKALSKTELLSVLHEVVPEFQNIPKVWWPSSSSHIYETDGRDRTGLRGQRVYVPVSDARQIPDLSCKLEKLFWAAGHGKVRIGKSGQCLKRTPMDHCVYQPNRLDFAAGASTGKGLVQKRGEPEVLS